MKKDALYLMYTKAQAERIFTADKKKREENKKKAKDNGNNPRSVFTCVPGVGKSIAADFEAVGLESVSDLAGADPDRLYTAICIQQNTIIDRCMLYVCRGAVYYASTPTRQQEKEKLQWWYWSDKNLGISGISPNHDNKIVNKKTRMKPNPQATPVQTCEPETNGASKIKYSDAENQLSRQAGTKRALNTDSKHMQPISQAPKRSKLN